MPSGNVGASRSTAFDFMLPFTDHAPTFNNGFAPPPPGHLAQDQHQQAFPSSSAQAVTVPEATTFLGDPSIFLADENLLELMKWGASSMGPDTFGTGLWPFPGDTPSSHGGNKPF